MTAHAASDSSRAWSTLLLAAAAISVSVLFASRWPSRVRDRYFLLSLGAVLLALELTYLVLVDMEPVSDFRGMWNMATTVSSRSSP